MSAKNSALLRAAAVLFALAPSTMIAPPTLAEARAHEHHADVPEIEIVVQGAYKPNRIELHEGQRVRLKFVRKEHNSCTKEVVFPALDIRRELPPNQPVIIELPVLKAGEYEFKCGMNMIKGKVIVTPHSHH